jgi:hypothetical protein
MQDLLASVTGIEPGVEKPDCVIETVGAADRHESPTAADSAGTSKRLECGEGKLRLRERQASFGAQPGVPARSRRLEPPRLLFERQQQ